MLLSKLIFVILNAHKGVVKCLLNNINVCFVYMYNVHT